VQVLEPYNPLHKRNLGVSVANALLEREVGPLPPKEPFIAAGIYVIYYTGDYEPYRTIAELNQQGAFEAPIYIGKAIPKGARRGGVGSGESPGTVLFARLQEHAESVEQATNLKSSDFFCRYLAVDDIWIPLGESLLIQRYMPVWNVCIDGYGNHDPGAGRYNQKRSSWDVLHPGRPWAERCAASALGEELLLMRLAKVLAGQVKPAILEE
jgi:hypothetical protein